MKKLITLSLILVFSCAFFGSCNKTQKTKEKAFNLIQTISSDYVESPSFIFETDPTEVKENGQTVGFEIVYIIQFEDGQRYRQKAKLNKNLTQVEDYYIIEVLN